MLDKTEITQIAEELLQIARRSREFSDKSKLSRDADRARKRLYDIVEDTSLNLRAPVEMPKIKDTNKKLDQTVAAIKRLRHHFKDLSEEQLITLHQLKRRNWSHLRRLDSNVRTVDEQLESIAEVLEKSKLDATKHKNIKRSVHTAVGSCALFFDEYLARAAVSAGNDSTIFAEFVRCLLQRSGYECHDPMSIIRSVVGEYKRIWEKLPRARYSGGSPIETD